MTRVPPGYGCESTRRRVARRAGCGEPASTLSVSVVWAYGSCVPSSARTQRILEEAGIDAASLVDPRTRIPMAVTNRLLEALLEEKGDPTLGLNIGRDCPPGAYGMVEQLARSVPTLRESIECYARYTPLIQESAEVELLLEGPHALIVYRCHEPQPAAVTDFALSYCLRSMRRNVRGGIEAVEVRFARAAPSCRERYAELLGVPVRFDALHDAVVIRRDDLARPMREAYPAVRAALEARAERAFERLVQAGSFVPRVRGCIRAQLGRGGPRLEETARRLHVSPATLRRRLAEEGTSFRDLLDALRAEEACRDVLDPRLDLTGIASRLGFAHPNGFYKAFRRWTGLSPREYRARHESR